jgi:hypothetical protein
MFSDTQHMHRQTLCRLAPPYPFHLPFPSFSDVAEAPSYFASTVVSFSREAWMKTNQKYAM